MVSLTRGRGAIRQPGLHHPCTRTMLVRALVGLALCSVTTSTTISVDCASGSDAGDGSESRPLRTVHAALSTLRQRRIQDEAAAPATVQIKGLCELPSTMTLGSSDSHTAFVGVGDGAILSGGTALGSGARSAAASAAAVQTIDLKKFNFTEANLGKLLGRGYTGGSACIDLDNLESSAAELFFRPGGANSLAGARSSGAEEVGTMRLARFPSVENAVPAVGVSNPHQ